MLYQYVVSYKFLDFQIPYLLSQLKKKWQFLVALVIVQIMRQIHVIQGLRFMLTAKCLQCSLNSLNSGQWRWGSMSLTVYLSYQSSLNDNWRKSSVYIGFNTSHTLRDIYHAWTSSWYGMDRHDQHGCMVLPVVRLSFNRTQKTGYMFRRVN